MIPVEGHKGLYRDEKSNAIVNCNDYEYQEYLRAKNSSLDEKGEIENLKTELSEIKSLLAKLLENKT
jgi:hypothetical protein